MKHLSSKAIHLQSDRTQFREHSAPIYMTSSFCYDNAEQMRAVFADEEEAFIYSRFSNPNVLEFTDKMAALEGAEAGFATASGMSSIFAIIMSQLKTGDHIITCSSIFGSTYSVFKKYLGNWGIEYSFADLQQPEKWEDFVKPNTKMIFLETPTNPGLDIIDLEVVNAIAKKHHLLFVVDNCFATPYGQQPVKFGADLVMHSATKWIDGQGRTLGGVIVGKQNLINEIYLFSRNTGPSLSPFTAWLLSKSLETLDVRMERHTKNAEELAKRLEGHTAISKVKYPFLASHAQYAIAKKQMYNGGGLVCFDLKDGVTAGRKFLNNLKMLNLTANLGDTRSIASHPASTTHAKMTTEEQLSVGITPGLIRISVGLEHIDDICEDIFNALK